MARLFLGRNALLAIAGAALVGAGVGAAWQWVDNRRAASAHLQRDIRSVAAEVVQRLGAFETGLRGTRGALIAVTPRGITRDRFRSYARSRDFDREFPGSRGFGYIRRVPAGAEAGFTAAARRDGAGDFRIRELAPHDGEHFVIQYIEPQAPNAPAVGLDVASEPNRRAAALDALRSGEPRLTGPVTLVQASGQPGRGLLFLLPVYEGADPPVTLQARLRRTVGWVYVPIIVDELLASDAREPDEPALRISDVTGEAAIALYGAEPPPSTLREATTIDLYGRRWQLEVSATPALLHEVGAPVWRTALASGLLALLLGSLVAGGLGLRASRARLREHRERLAALVEDSADSIIGVTPAGRVLEWNPAAARMFGFREDEVVGRSLVDLIVPPERVAEDAFLLARAGGGERITGFETIRRHRGGGLVYVELNASVLRAGLQGDVIAMTLRDIGERKDAEARLQQQQAALEDEVLQRSEELASVSALQRAILDSASYAIIATDPDGVITLFNPAAEAILGYASDEVVGRDTPALFHDRAEMAERASRLTLEYGRPVQPGFDVFVARVRDGGYETSEWTYIARDGTRVPVLLTVTAMRGDDGGLLGYVGIAVDLRDALARQEALEVSERKLRGLFELSPVGIALTDARGRFVEFNDAFRGLVGYGDDELRNLDYEALTVPGLEAKERAAIEQARRTGRYGPYETQYMRKDGTHVPVRLNGVSLRLNGRLHFWSLVENITGQREVEDAMRQALTAAEGASAAKSDFLANMS
ncbi:MAG: PAS domain S-box protein, partial [Pseudomonas sp.]|nr:PAS domain S-box protein [Pseudomonas sp.]